MHCHHHERKDIGTAIGNEIIKDMEERKFKFELGQMVKHIAAATGDEESWSHPLKFAVISRAFWEHLDGTTTEEYFCSASNTHRDRCVDRVQFDACELMPF